MPEPCRPSQKRSPAAPARYHDQPCRTRPTCREDRARPRSPGQQHRGCRRWPWERLFPSNDERGSRIDVSEAFRGRLWAADTPFSRWPSSWILVDSFKRRRHPARTSWKLVKGLQISGRMEVYPLGGICCTSQWWMVATPAVNAWGCWLVLDPRNMIWISTTLWADGHHPGSAPGRRWIPISAEEVSWRAASHPWIDGWFQSSEQKSPEDFVRMDPLWRPPLDPIPWGQEDLERMCERWYGGAGFAPWMGSVQGYVERPHIGKNVWP